LQRNASDINPGGVFDQQLATLWACLWKVELGQVLLASMFLDSNNVRNDLSSFLYYHPIADSNVLATYLIEIV
jgi:hypothetical protein